MRGWVTPVPRRRLGLGPPGLRYDRLKLFHQLCPSAQIRGLLGRIGNRVPNAGISFALHARIIFVPL